MKRFNEYKNWITGFIFAVAVIAVYKTFDNFYKVAEIFGTVIKSLSPFIIGFIIAYILNIPANKISDICQKSKYNFLKKQNKAISIIGVYFLLVTVVYVSVSAIAPAIYRNIVDLYSNIPLYIGKAMAAIEDIQSKYGFTLFEFNEVNIMNAFDKIFGKFDLAEFGKYARGVVNITSGFVNVLIGIIVSVYMLIEKEKIEAFVKRVVKICFKKEKGGKLIGILNNINNVFSKYLFCLILDAAIMAILATIILSIMKVKYAIILGIVIGVFNFIPYFGAILAVCLSVVITLITGGWVQGLWVAIFLVALQQIDGNFIGPKIMGEVLDASPLLIILAVTLGGGLFGIVGMIVSVPILVTVKMALTQFIDEKETEKSES